MGSDVLVNQEADYPICTRPYELWCLQSDIDCVTE